MDPVLPVEAAPPAQELLRGPIVSYADHRHPDRFGFCFHLRNCDVRLPGADLDLLGLEVHIPKLTVLLEQHAEELLQGEIVALERRVWVESGHAGGI